MQPRLDTLFAYLPQDRRRAIIDGAALPARSVGAVLFVDVSGWTPLAESLVLRLGARRGVEELARAINQAYELLVGEVERFGGSVIGFAGDALTCWFADERAAHSVAPDSEPAPALRAAAACALEMQAALAVPGASSANQDAQRIPGALSLKAALAHGPVSRFVVGDPAIQLLDVLAGATLDRVVALEQAAKAGEVVVDAPTAAALAPALPVAAWRTHAGEPIAVLGATAPTGSRTSWITTTAR